MVTIKRLLCAACLLAGMTLQCAAQEASVPITDDFGALDLTWNNGKTSYRGRWAVMVNPAGLITICGAGQMTDSTSAQATMAWLRSNYVTYEGTKILKDFSFFTKVSSNKDVAKAQASCKASKVQAPRGRFSVSVGSPPASAKF